MGDKDKSVAHDTEQLILKAAEKEFIQKGYAGARTSSIAEAAGVTHAMLHYYFRTKDKLFEKILADKVSLISQIVISSVGDDSLPFFERLTRLIERHIDFVAANPDLPRFIIGEVFSDPDRVKFVLDEIKSRPSQAAALLQRQIDECASRGECRKVDAVMLLLDIVSLNLFCFAAAPMINIMFDGIVGDEDFLGRRKKENVETIMRKLRP